MRARGGARGRGRRRAAGRSRSALVPFTALACGLVLTLGSVCSATAGRAVVVAEGGGRLSVSAEDTPLPELLAEAPRDGVVAVLNRGRLSFTASNTDWSTVVRELAAQTGVALRVDRVPGGAVTIDLHDVAVERALRLLFGSEAGFVLVYRAASAPGQPAALDQVTVTFRDAAAGRARPSDTPAPGPRDPHAVLASRGDGAAAMAIDGDAASSPAPSLEDADPLGRQEAIDAIMERGDGSGVEEIRQVLLGDQDHEVRTRAVTALGRLGTPEALEALRLALKDRALAVRLTAIDAIAGFETRRARAVLRDALGDRDEQVRSGAAAAMQELRGR